MGEWGRDEAIFVKRDAVLLAGGDAKSKRIEGINSVLNNSTDDE